MDRLLLPEARPDVTKSALAGDCPIAHEALATFCAFLGSFAGNVALTFGCTRRSLYSRRHFTANCRFLKSIGISQSF